VGIDKIEGEGEGGGFCRRKGEMGRKLYRRGLKEQGGGKKKEEKEARGVGLE
jgi:hypothetical protein